MTRVSSMRRSSYCCCVFFFVLVINLQHSLADDINAFVYAGCTQAKFTPGSPYQYNVNALFSSLANTAGFTPFANFSSSYASDGATVYGLYQCRGDLSVSDCQNCVRYGISQVSSLCAGSSGGALQLQGCYIRYGKEQFIGQLDKSVAYQKCGSGLAAAADGGINGEVMGTRDSVLGSLTAGGNSGPYRAVAAGHTEGIAQCVGDLNPTQCGDCINTAANALRSTCGLASSGEFYLTKCYVKYSSKGDHGSHTDHGHHSDLSHVDETSKTIAIIVGSLAGVVLVFIFLSFLKRAVEGDKGKQ